MDVSAEPEAAVRVEPRGKVTVLRLCRADQRNRLTQRMIAELDAGLRACEADDGVRIVVLAADGEVFCDGMDFGEASATELQGGDEVEARVRPFFDLLKRFTESPKWVVALVDGRVNAGGVGLVAASDYALATPRADFGLSEVMFGLLPATVAPFLIRRCGFQAAYRMALTAARADAARAAELGLVDEVSADPEDSLRQLLLRIDRVRPEILVAGKRYFNELCPVSEEAGRRAVAELARLISDPETLGGIRDFLEGRALPWQRR